MLRNTTTLFGVRPVEFKRAREYLKQMYPGDRDGDDGVPGNERKLLRTIRGNLSDQDPVASLFFRPEKSAIRCGEEFHCSCPVLG